MASSSNPPLNVALSDGKNDSNNPQPTISNAGRTSTSPRVAVQATYYHPDQLETLRVQREADAFSTFVVIDTLLAGAAVGAFFEFDETLFNGAPYLLIFFMGCLSLMIGTTVFGAGVMAGMHVSTMKALSKQSAGHLRPLLKNTAKVRTFAAGSTYLAFLLAYIVLAIYGSVKMIDVGREKNDGDITLSAIISVIVSTAVLIIGGAGGVLFLIYSFKPRLAKAINGAAKYYRELLKLSQDQLNQNNINDKQQGGKNFAE